MRIAIQRAEDGDEGGDGRKEKKERRRFLSGGRARLCVSARRLRRSIACKYDRMCTAAARPRVSLSIYSSSSASTGRSHNLPSLPSLRPRPSVLLGALPHPLLAAPWPLASPSQTRRPRPRLAMPSIRGTTWPRSPALYVDPVRERIASEERANVGRKGKGNVGSACRESGGRMASVSTKGEVERFGSGIGKEMGESRGKGMGVSSVQSHLRGCTLLTCSVETNPCAVAPPA